MDPYKAKTLLFIGAVSFFRIVYSGWFELSLDEGYYWLWSRHPSLGYYDHSPMVAWLMALTCALGESERFVRLGAVLCAAASSYYAYLTTREVFNDGKAAFHAAVLLNLLPVFSMGALIMTPDSPLFMFWAMAAYFGARLANSQRPAHWYAIGFFFGLAMLSKYTAALFAPALLVYVIVSVENRAWLFRKEPYLAFALSTAMFLPVIIWNAQRDWISFRFQLSHGLAGDGPGWLVTMGEFWGAQIGITGVFLFFFIMAAPFWTIARGLREKRDDYLYLGAIFAFLACFFVVNSTRSRMEGNWAVPMYFTAVAVTPVFISALAAEKENWARLVRGAYVFSLWFAAALLVYMHIQIVSPVLPMPQKHEISRRVFGWKALAARTDAHLAGLGKGGFIISNRYQIATLLTYYTEGHREAYITNGKGRFDYLGSVDHLEGAHAVYVTETGRDDIERIMGSFSSVEKMDAIRIERHGQLIREFTFYKCYNYRGGLIEI